MDQKEFEADDKAQSHLKFSSKEPDGLTAVVEKYADQIAIMANADGIDPADWLNTVLFIKCKRARQIQLKKLLDGVAAQGYTREEIRDCAAE